MTYRAFSGDETRRELSPHGLVVHAGRWYLAAHDHLRDDLRTFRVDRMLRMRAIAETAVEPPDGFDAVAYVSDVPRSRALGAGRSRSSSSCPSTRRRGAFPRRSPSSSTRTAQRCFACASGRSTGRRRCSPVSAAPSPSGGPTSCVRACGRLASAWRAPPSVVEPEPAHSAGLRGGAEVGRRSMRLITDGSAGRRPPCRRSFAPRGTRSRRGRARRR